MKKMMILNLLYSLLYLNVYKVVTVTSFQITPSSIHTQTHIRTNTHQPYHNIISTSYSKKPFSFHPLKMQQNDEFYYLSDSNESNNSKTQTQPQTQSNSSNQSTGTSTTDVPSSASLQQALMEAQKLKERAMKERLEAEKMSVELALNKIELLEKELKTILVKEKQEKELQQEKEATVSSTSTSTTSSSSSRRIHDGKSLTNGKSTDSSSSSSNSTTISKIEKTRLEIQDQIKSLKRQLNESNASIISTKTQTTSTPLNNGLDDGAGDEALVTNTMETETMTAPSSSSTTTTPKPSIPTEMPKELFNKRLEAFRRFPKEVKELYAKAVHASENDDMSSIIEKLYVLEQEQKRHMKRQNSIESLIDIEKDDGSDENEKEEAKFRMLNIANAQAGYTSLPPPVQSMIKEQIGMIKEENTTCIVEVLLDTKKVRVTGELGGVEFAMGDPGEEEDANVYDDVDDYMASSPSSSSPLSKLGFGNDKEREFTKEEIQSAIDLYENLPQTMKSMLANGVGADASNSTYVIDRMIEEKMIKPNREGVEFVVFGDADDQQLVSEAMENDGYVRSMLPASTRKEFNTPPTEVVDAFFTEVLGRKTFNPTSKPEVIPGGYIIRGENKLKTYDELMIAIEEALEKSSVAGKLQPYVIRDPTAVTEDQFQTNTFELPVIMVTGKDVTPDTNRFVKPLITAFGGLSIAAFSLAVCFSTQDVSVDPIWVEEMVTPLVMSIILTQVAHEASHQIVAWKDKFKAGAPTIIPSLQTGLSGCITPIQTPPPNFNSLFDFAISGPLVGIVISVLLMYTGLEQQVFMDAVTQSQLPSLPVELVRSSSFAAGMVEWLLGDGVLLSSTSTDLIRLHPLAIAGFVGIITNALNLLPIGNTDGGRIALSVFGRSLSRVTRTVTIGIIVISSFFVGDALNVLLFYTIYAQIWQRDPEIACKNEVENVNDVRAVIAVFTGLLTALAVIPLP